MRIGYIRVSTAEQNTIRQEVLMRELEVDELFIDRASGKRLDRPELQRMLDYVRKGDTVIVESISRFARNIRDLLELVEAAYRQIVIPRRLAEELIVWKDYAEHTLKLEISGDGFVFCNSKNGKMRTYTGFRSSYYHFLDRHGFPHEGMNLHAYRHTCATVLLENGVEPKLIQQLGHSSITTTLNIYSHVSQELLTTAADALESMI